MEFVEKLISSIIENRHMPKVQVEREISPILDIFIEDILESASKFNQNIDKGTYRFIAPEFPLQSLKLENNKKTNRSTNIDYLLLNEDTQDLYFVELKTDSSSFKYEQFEIYEDLISTKSLMPNELYDFLSKSLTSTKYQNLKKFILEKMNFNKDSKENPFDNIKNIKLVYIAPRKMFERQWKGKNNRAIRSIENNHSIINFHDFKNIEVSKYKDEWKYIRKYLAQLDKN